MTAILRSWVLTATLLVMASANMAARAQSSDDLSLVKLGEAVADLRTGTLAIDVSGKPGAFRAIRVAVKGQPLEIGSIAVEFSDRTEQFIPRKVRLLAYERTRPAVLTGGDRFLDTVRIAYPAKPNATQPVPVIVYGMQSRRGASMSRPAAVVAASRESSPLERRRAVAPRSGPQASAPQASAPETKPRSARGIAPGEPAPTADQWQVMPVFYGTDRVNTGTRDKPVYNASRATDVALGLAEVTIPRKHQLPQLERPYAINIPGWGRVELGSEDPNEHFTIKSLREVTLSELRELVSNRLAGSQTFKDHALVFVHGYNTGFADALYRTAQIAYDLEFDGAPFVFSWPARTGLLSLTHYNYDRDRAEEARPHLQKFLQLISKETSAKSISIIAHSMGNRVLLDVLKDLRLSAPDSVKISQVILAAPDVSVDAFRGLAGAMQGIAAGVTLYASSKDLAMDASRIYAGGVARAGDVQAGVPVVVPGVDTIDVSEISTGIVALNHSTFAQDKNLVTDISLLLKTGQRPPDQRLAKLIPRSMTDTDGNPIRDENGQQQRFWRYQGSTHTVEQSR